MATPPPSPARAATEVFRYIEELGRGAHGRVILAEHTPSEELVAIKLIDRNQDQFDRRSRREMLTNARLSHPHIAQLKTLFLTEQDLAVVLEFCNSGDLHQRVRCRGPMMEDLARSAFQQLITAVDYMHGREVVSRDIKPANILLHEVDNILFVKLTDFGLARTNDSMMFEDPASRVGTPLFMAPEVILAGEFSRYNARLADAWSCGATLYYMLTGRFPFARPTDPPGAAGCSAAMRRALDCDYDMAPLQQQNVSAEAGDLLRRLFVREPSERAGIPDVMQHPFFLHSLPQGALQLKEICLRRHAENEAKELGMLNLVESIMMQAAIEPASSPSASSVTSSFL